MYKCFVGMTTGYNNQELKKFYNACDSHSSQKYAKNRIFWHSFESVTSTKGQNGTLCILLEKLLHLSIE